MKKRFFAIVTLFVVSIFILLSNGISAFAEETVLYLGGMPAGFLLDTRGATVVGTCDVVGDTVVDSPAKKAGVTVGDVILCINDVEVNNASDIANQLTNGDVKILKVKRNGEIIYLSLFPALDASGDYKMGVFIRDDVGGIGTVTYFTDKGYGALGHPVVDENGDVVEVRSGNLFKCRITGVVKGEKGKAGELRGVFIKKNAIASVDKNTCSGVYGCMNDDFDFSSLRKVSVGTAKIGAASIFTTIDGSLPKEYDVAIVKVDETKGDYKNYVIKITDKDLISITGGIVQGMSGSPILQNGKIVGAVTHVFINDPTRGFGISIKNMLNT